MNAIKQLRRVKRKLVSMVDGRLDPQRVEYKKAWRYMELRREEYLPLVDCVASRLNASDTLVDVGANIGYFSLLLMERIRFQGEAHLFEPLPHLADLCMRTFSGGPYHVQIHNVGLGDVKGEVTLYTSTDGNIGWNTMLPEWASRMRPVRVPIIPFDELGISEVQFIKVDVEGFEYNVLRGMLDTLRRASHLPSILCEVAPPQSHPHGAETAEIFTRLQELGYQTFDCQGNKIQIQTLTATTDVLLLPS